MPKKKSPRAKKPTARKKRKPVARRLANDLTPVSKIRSGNGFMLPHDVHEIEYVALRNAVSGTQGKIKIEARDEYGYRRMLVLPKSSGVRITERNYSPRGNPTKKLTLAQDPIGDRFDRCVTARRKQLGVDGAKRVCANSLNKAHPGALAAAQRKANALRKAGKLPPRAARGSNRTSGVKLIGDVRKGDVFQIGKKTYLAKSSAKPVRVRGQYVVKLTVATGSGDTTRAMQRSVKSKVRVMQQAVRMRNNPRRAKPAKKLRPLQATYVMKSASKIVNGDVFHVPPYRATHFAASDAQPFTSNEGYWTSKGHKKAREAFVAIYLRDQREPLRLEAKKKVRVAVWPKRARRNPTVIRPERVVERETRFNPMRTLGMHK